MKIPFALIFTIGFIGLAQGEHILFFFGISTYSHRITVWPLVEKLVERGHNVTFFMPYPHKNPNPKVIEINPKLKEGASFGEFDLLNTRLAIGKFGMQINNFQFIDYGMTLCQGFLNDPEVLSWANEASFDLVVLDALHNECGLALAYKFQARTAVFGTSIPFGWWAESYGYPAETNWIPEPQFAFHMPLNFVSRLISTFIPLIYYFKKQYIMFPTLEPVMRDKLNIPNMPSLDEIDRNVSLILTNNHFSEEVVGRSLPPLVISVGGMHCQESTKSLPKEFENFINGGGNDGFIYVSFGSAVQISTAPEELRSIFYNAFKNTQIRFLWKWEGSRPKEMPANVLTSSWMPQQDVLAHPKIRAFITHGGLLGMQEAVFHGVPMIAIPVFAEQHYNAERLERTGRGIPLEIIGLTQSKLEITINTILTEDRFRQKVQQASKMFKDRPQRPVDTAVWWTEYVLRHEDVSCLRPLASSQTWFQRRSLDIWSFVITIILVVLTFIALILKKCLSVAIRLFKPNRDKKSLTQKLVTKSKAKIS